MLCASIEVSMWRGLPNGLYQNDTAALLMWVTSTLVSDRPSLILQGHRPQQ